MEKITFYMVNDDKIMIDLRTYSERQVEALIESVLNKEVVYVSRENKTIFINCKHVVSAELE